MRLAGDHLDAHGFLADIDAAVGARSMRCWPGSATDPERPAGVSGAPQPEHRASGANPVPRPAGSVSERPPARGRRDDLGKSRCVGGLHGNDLMRIGLVIYGRLDTLTGGYLYDRFLSGGFARRAATGWR
ncbi:MAG: hypothetical protein MZV70_08585 [Desulfobacterales bacterium]|nr:hypothetical protein [Desulfobacterales bacterium]